MLQTAVYVSKKLTFAFFRLVFFRRVLWLNDTHYSKSVSRDLPARNTLVQLLALCTTSESHNTRRYRQTDGRSDGRQDDANANSRSYRVAVQSATNG